ncbi:MAG: hypothetical protein ACR2F8_07815 [Caulobacteraceae bacterium]
MDVGQNVRRNNVPENRPPRSPIQILDLVGEDDAGRIGADHDLERISLDLELMGQQIIMPRSPL